MKPYFQIILALLCSYSFYLLAQESDAKDVPFDYIAQFIDVVSKKFHQSENEQHDFDHDLLQLTLSAECEPLTTIAGCVNIFSGHFFQIEKDLKGNTIEPLDFIRYYDSGNTSESFLGFGFGSGFPLWASDILKGERHHYALISEREGFLLPYRDKESGPSKICSIDPRLLKKGYTNLSRAVISGHANFVNWKAAFRTNSHALEGEWLVQLADGSKRIYGKCVQIDKGQQARMNFPTKTAYLLTREIKPNLL